MQALFEITSAFGTVGLSTGITPDLGVGAKLLSILLCILEGWTANRSFALVFLARRACSFSRR